MPASGTSPAHMRAWIALAALAGLGLRIAAAQGSLWLDEAWSAVLADQVGTPLGVFVGINHDNNHHLNTLWLQWAGIGASPLLARALSIAAGTLAIVVAGLIGARRGRLAGILTAALFALSPVMVSLGSEARGYAPMMLMALIALWHVDRFLDGDAEADRPVTIAVCFFVGALAQLTIVFIACALVGWVFLTLWRKDGWRSGLIATVRLLGPSVAALLLALAIAFGPTWIEGEEFRLGSVAPFSFAGFARGLGDLLHYSWGGPALLMLLFGALALPLASRERLPFYALAILAFPLTVAALRPLNAEYARYYLLVGLALLLLLGEGLAELFRRGGAARVLAACALAVIAASSLANDLALIRDRRGDVGPAVARLAAIAPRGADVGLARESGLALLQVAAAEARYPVRLTRDCGRTRFVFAEWFEGENPDALAARCGSGLHSVASATSHGLSGQNWTLYERVR